MYSPQGGPCSGIADLAAATWLLPVPDRHIPGKAASAALAAQLRSHRTEGTSIAIHGRNGIGRASTLGATVPCYQVVHREGRG